MAPKFPFFSVLPQLPFVQIDLILENIKKRDLFTFLPICLFFLYLVHSKEGNLQFYGSRMVELAVGYCDVQTYMTNVITVHQVIILEEHTLGQKSETYLWKTCPVVHTVFEIKHDHTSLIILSLILFECKSQASPLLLLFACLLPQQRLPYPNFAWHLIYTVLWK